MRDTETNATWGMRFFWPFTSEYLVIYLDEDYQTTIVGRTKRDYVWIMARQPSIEDERYEALLSFIESKGHDLSKVRKVPQSGAQSSPSDP